MAPSALLRKQVGEPAWSRVDAAARAAVEGAIGTSPAQLTMTALLSVGVAR